MGLSTDAGGVGMCTDEADAMAGAVTGGDVTLAAPMRCTASCLVMWLKDKSRTNRVISNDRISTKLINQLLSFSSAGSNSQSSGKLKPLY